MNRKIIAIGTIGMLLLTGIASLPVMGIKAGIKSDRLEKSSRTTLAMDEIIVPDDYPTIQEAIDHANPGDTIRVLAGIYHENINVYKMVNIIGSGFSDTIIVGDGKDHVVNISADGVKLIGFTVKGSAYAGIYITSHYNTIQENFIEDNGYGIKLNQSCGNHIVDNKIGDNGNDGIHLYRAFGNTISGNAIFDNQGIGIFLESSSIGNEIKYNTICRNGVGVKISETSRSNIVHHNDFVDNIQNANCPSNSNQWDDGHEGNYWSDYTGEDTDGDGIGDTPYNIPGGGVDNYPLMDPVNPNNAPNRPSRPDGPTSGKVGNSYNYSTSTTDPDGDRVRYGWDWNGDGEVDEWTRFYESGETCRILHTWTKKGTYNVRVKAQDENGLESEWSDPLPVSMPKNEHEKTASACFSYPKKGYIYRFHGFHWGFHGGYYEELKALSLFLRVLNLLPGDTTIMLTSCKYPLNSIAVKFWKSSGIKEIKVFINGEEKNVIERFDNPLSEVWRFECTCGGNRLWEKNTYIVKFEAYDAEGNIVESDYMTLITFVYWL